MGMYFLAHSWTNNRFAASVSGIAFVFSALMLNFLMWPNNMAGFAWLPWVVLAAERAFGDPDLRRLHELRLAARLLEPSGERFERVGRGWIGNEAASGTEIIQRLGEQRPLEALIGPRLRRRRDGHGTLHPFLRSSRVAILPSSRGSSIGALRHGGSTTRLATRPPRRAGRSQRPSCSSRGTPSFSTA